MKERVYPKQVNQEGDVQRYGELKAIKKDETIFAAYDKAEMRKAKIMIVANSEFVHTSKSLFWPDVIMLAAVDLDLLQSVSMAIGVRRQTDMNPTTIVFAGINDHLHSRGFLSRLREPTTAENAVWPAIKDILESMGEVVDATKEGSFTKTTPRVVFALSPGYAHLPDGLKFVYAMVALLSEGKYDVVISAPNRMIEMENLRPLRTELTCGVVGYRKRIERIQGPCATHAGTGRGAGVGTVQLQSTPQTETGNRRRPSSDHSDFERFMVPRNGSSRRNREKEKFPGD